jgi:hypothetical protein
VTTDIHSGHLSSERQITRGADNCILTNIGVWSPDGNWIVFDARSDPAGERFDGQRILIVNVHTGEVRELFRSKNGACCGVATFHPLENRVFFILGPEHPTPDWSYNAYHRQGVIVDVASPGQKRNLDARDVVPPFTPGALRGGSHVHVSDPAGQWVSFTYEDHVLAQHRPGRGYEENTRNVAVSVPGRVQVPPDHPRNHDGEYFSAVITQTRAEPTPGSNEISRACEEGWVGTRGYVRADGTRQKRAVAFQGWVCSLQAGTMSEVFIIDLPEDISKPGAGPLQGTEHRMPCPPAGTSQRRLTHTTDRLYPGIQGPRHWLRSSPDGSQIAFLMKDNQGIVQIWTVSPNGGPPRQLTANPWPISSAFSWSPDGCLIAHVMDNSIWAAHVKTGHGYRLTPRTDDVSAPRPEACVFSPTGDRIAYVRNIPGVKGRRNQVHVVSVPETLRFG